MPQNQSVRDLVAKMKLIPISELIKGKKILFCEDSIVRGTQLRDTIKRLLEAGANEVHMRATCPPLFYGCRYLNFSRSRSLMDLASRLAIKKLEGGNFSDLSKYTDPESEAYKNMMEIIRKELGFSTLKYQIIDDLVETISLPENNLCTYCWDGEG